MEQENDREESVASIEERAKKGLTILEFKARNIKNLKVVEIKSEGNVVILEGANEAGKSAVLDSILMAMTGKKIEEPIRSGQKDAEVILLLGKCPNCDENKADSDTCADHKPTVLFKIKRVITKSSARLEVTSPHRIKPYPSPQTLLDSLFGVLSFDPLAFKDLKPVDQAKMLLQAAGVDVAKDARDRKLIFDERTVANRAVKNLKVQLDVMPDLPMPRREIPDEERSMQDQMQVVRDIEARQLKVTEWGAQLKVLHNNKAQIKDAINEEEIRLNETRQRIERTTNTLKAQLEAARLESETVEKTFATHIAEADTDSINAEAAINTHEQGMPGAPSDQELDAAKQLLNQVEKLNEAVRAKKARTELGTQLVKVEDESKGYDDNLLEMDRQRDEKLAGIDLGVKGLTVDQIGFYVDDIPFHQLATSKQIRVSAAIAMSLNPDLKVILVREGSLLDKNSLAELIKQVGEKDYQLWIERVETRASGNSVWIEDGQAFVTEKDLRR